MAEHARAIKATIVALFALLGELLGWFGIMVLVFAGLMIADWITGSWAAKTTGEWSSERARAGIRHKGGMLVIVGVGLVFDLLVGLVVNIPSVALVLPFEYSVLFGPIVVAWYIVTELGSLVENAVKGGANCPPFLTSALKIMQSKISKAGDNAVGKDSEE